MLKINLIKLHKSWFKEVPNTRKQEKKKNQGLYTKSKNQKIFHISLQWICIGTRTVIPETERKVDGFKAEPSVVIKST